MAKAFKLKTYALPTLTEKQIIDAVETKRKGVFRELTWITDEFQIGSDIITITKTAIVRIGIKYDNMKIVKERKAAEDAAIGVPKIRKESSYTRLKDADGNFIAPSYIVWDKTTTTRKFLQVCVANAYDIRTKMPRYTVEKFFVNGVETEPTTEMMSARRKVTPRTTPIETWVLSLNKITNIK